jgi:hypothetical protein
MRHPPILLADDHPFLAGYKHCWRLNARLWERLNDSGMSIR